MNKIIMVFVKTLNFKFQETTIWKVVETLEEGQEFVATVKDKVYYDISIYQRGDTLDYGN